MKNKIYHTVRIYFVFHLMTFRTVWYILFSIWWQFERCCIFCFSFYDRNVIKWKTKYTTPFELSSNEKQNIPHRSNCHEMKNKIYHTIRTAITCNILFFILWQFERCGIFSFSFYNSSNGVVYFFFHFMTVWTVWYLLFSFYDCSNGECHQMKNKIYHTVRTVIKWKTKYTTPFELS
jgi:hypothetical protein